MVSLLLYSRSARSGKTALAMALARRLLRQGRKVGYWKPLASMPDGDSAFARQLLGLGVAFDTRPTQWSDPTNRAGTVAWLKAVLEEITEGKDVLLVEVDAAALDLAGLRGVAFVELLGAAGSAPNTIAIVRYRGGALAEEVIAARDELGALAGVLINGVAAAHRWFVEERVMPLLAEQAVPIVALLPQDPPLGTTTVRDLANALQAEVLVEGGPGALDELFESVMFGSMSAEDGRRYFDRKQRKLVISRGDHPDVHLAALSTSTRCLLLAGGHRSYPFVLDKAEAQGVPVLRVTMDMAATIERVDGLIADSRAWTPAHIERFDQLVSANGGWEAIERLLNE